MKKVALFLFGICALMAVGVNAANLSDDNSGQQNVECTVPCNQTPCAPDTICNPVPCATDTVCAPAPCTPAPGCC